MNVTGSGGKGSARRKGANDEAYAANYDRVFNSGIQCPNCDSTDIELRWIDSIGAMPEWEHGECEACNHEWNNCARED